MKKTLFLILCLLIIPGLVHASVVNYDIDDVLMDASIQSNGDLKVKELIIMDGTFHGYVREIAYKNSRLINHTPVNLSNDAIYNGSGLKDVSIKSQVLMNDTIDFATLNSSFIPLTKAYYASDAVSGNYVESSMQDGKSYTMYYTGNDQLVGFLLSYTISDVVVLHNDVAELYWTFIGSDFTDDIGQVKIRLHLPNEDNSEYFRIWAHGDLTGNINFLNSSTLEASIQKLKSGSEIDIRTTFNKELVSNVSSSKQSHIDAFNDIINTEEERAKVANDERKQAEKITMIVNSLSMIYIVFMIIWWIFIYLKYDREYQSTFTNRYNREFIEDYPVEVVDYLMHHSITENAMSASILNLIYKKNIKVEEISDKKKNKEYQFTLLNRENVSDTEDVLLDFLFEKVGSNQSFTTKDLTNYAKSTKTYRSYESNYTNWVRCVKKDGESEHFFETNGLPIISAIFLLLGAIFLLYIVLYYGVDTAIYLGKFPLSLGLIVLLLTISFLIYSFSIRKRTRKGHEDYVRWIAFKRFLKDFGDFKIKELPELALWERYLVYATVFGIADSVEKAMNVKIKEMPDTVLNSYNDFWFNYHLAHYVSNSISSSRSAYRSTLNTSQIANSSFSSGSGFGGGFSSGGGFGGGGGGGHGF